MFTTNDERNLADDNRMLKVIRRKLNDFSSGGCLDSIYVLWEFPPSRADALYQQCSLTAVFCIVLNLIQDLGAN